MAPNWGKVQVVDALAVVELSLLSIEAKNQSRPVSQSPHQAIDMEYSFIQHTLPKAEGLEWSDLESLTLSITVPAGAEAKKLPVFVFVHGGGFFIGSGSWPHYDQARIVKLSAEAGMPMIGITIK